MFVVSSEGFHNNAITIICPKKYNKKLEGGVPAKKNISDPASSMGY